MSGTSDSPSSALTPGPSPSKRKLVSVRRIGKVERIPGSNQAAIHLDGWKVVVPKTRPMYCVGELVVYFEIDSFIPKIGPFWELFANAGQMETFRGKQGFRVKSRRHGGHLSQGVIYPLDAFPKINTPHQDRIRAVGRETATAELFSQSFAHILGVEKWEFTQTARTLPNLGAPPAFISMPGWDRIQNVEREMFSGAKRNKSWQITEKLDGVTMTVYKLAKDSKWAECLPALPADCPPAMQDENNRYGVCSRRADLIDRSDSLYWVAAKASGVLGQLNLLGLPNVAVQGELCGFSIEGNTMNYPEGAHEFIVFAIWDIDKNRYLYPKPAAELCNRLGIKHAPVLGYLSLNIYARDAQELLDKAEGKGMYGGVREGFVFKSLDGADQFKVISNSWLSVTGK